MEVLFENHNRIIRETLIHYERAFYKDFHFDQRFTGILGTRGVGKTSFLIHYLQKLCPSNERSLYISADHIYFSNNSLIDTCKKFHDEYDGQLLCIDEIHKYKNWNQELKNIYDSFPNIKILFSGSSSINLTKAKYDLSRRVNLKKMNGFSLREFLELKLNQKLPKLSLTEILKGKEAQDLEKIPKLLTHMKEYWQSGYYPIFTEFTDSNTYREALRNIIDKVIYEDISNFYSLKTVNLESFRKILYFIASSSPGGFSINKLAGSLEKDHTVTADYLEMMRETGLLRYLLNDKTGHSLIRKAEKIYFENTNLVYAINQSIGKETDLGLVRELFVLNQLDNSGYQAHYSKKGDISSEGYVFEIGGKSKSEKQIKDLENAYLVKDDILIRNKTDIPIYLFGFLS